MIEYLGNLHESTRTVTGCDNKQVSIQWPCNIQYDMVKRMTLTVTKSQSKVEHIASITSDGNVTIPQRYTKHVRARGTSGVLLTEAAVLDSGQYLTEVEYWNGSLIYEDFFLCIYVPPLILYDALNISVVKESEHCQSIICGQVIFSGFPAVSFIWETPKAGQTQTVSGSHSKIHGCPLASGTYKCRLEGPATKCLDNSYSLEASVFINSSLVSEMTSQFIFISCSIDGELGVKGRLALLILVPMAAVLVPAIVLGVWILRHMLSSPQRSETHHNLYGCIHKKSRSDFGSLMEDKSDGRDTPSPFPEEPDLEIEDEDTEEGDYQMSPMIGRGQITV
ncbi:uncharacterized protein LOC112576687 isoform X1 [Pomacea canaliculata]|uniref:uncharacterized protein LOC112576687 isoform X1 n=1 Tax=Pomacea canaliculata TaxID=400727 RepID=UPI000D72C50F|nr:uncharacterized protein LOC112576687 isoform X1 [Pomacea canaliculata]